MSVEDLRQLSAIIETVYRGATDVTAWPAVLQQVSTWLGANQAVMFTPFTSPANGGFVVPHGMTQATVESWSQVKHTQDLWAQRGAQRGLLIEGNVVTDQELATEAELRQSIWYQEFLSAQNIARFMCGMVFGAEKPDQICTGLSLYRSWSDPVFDAEVKARFGLLMPHISRALGLMLALRGAEMRLACTHAALNRLHVGVVLISSDESVTFANHAAERVFRQADGLSLKDAGGRLKPRLRIWHDAGREGVRLALRAALDRHLQVEHFNRKIHLARPSGLSPYTVQVSACTNAWTGDFSQTSPCAVLLVTDPAQRFHIDPASLGELHGLTPTEARVAIALLDEDRPDALAATFGVQPSTIRTHVARLHEKLGVNSRASLIKVLLSHAEP